MEAEVLNLLINDLLLPLKITESVRDSVRKI